MLTKGINEIYGGASKRRKKFIDGNNATYKVDKRDVFGWQEPFGSITTSSINTGTIPRVDNKKVNKSKSFYCEKCTHRFFSSEDFEVHNNENHKKGWFKRLFTSSKP